MDGFFNKVSNGVDTVNGAITGNSIVTHGDTLVLAVGEVRTWAKGTWSTSPVIDARANSPSPAHCSTSAPKELALGLIKMAIATCFTRKIFPAL
jgi:hypothetical protein